MKEYTVEISGLPHTFLLEEDDAKRMGAKSVEDVKTKQAAAPKNKARTPQGKS